MLGGRLLPALPLGDVDSFLFLSMATRSLPLLVHMLLLLLPPLMLLLLFALLLTLALPFCPPSPLPLALFIALTLLLLLLPPLLLLLWLFILLDCQRQGRWGTLLYAA